VQPNGNGNGQSVTTSISNALRVVAPIVALIASAAAFWTQATVKNAVVELRTELQEYAAKQYESRESAAMYKAMIQDRMSMDQRERDDLRSQILRMDERLRYLETRRTTGN